MAGPEFSQGELEARCRDLATGLESADIATSEELAALTPGSPENPDTSWWAWVRFHGRLQVLNDRHDRPASPVTAELVQDDTRVTDALRGAPKRVRLLGRPAVPVRKATKKKAAQPAVEAEPREVWVHPKSYLALLECHVRGIRLGWLADRIHELEQEPDARALDLLTAAIAELSYQQRVLAWIATTPGPGLPFPDFPATPPIPPVDFDEWDGWDHLALLQGFQEVNSLKLPALEKLLHGVPREDSTGPQLNGWSVFFSTVAQELGDDTVRIMRDRSLVGLMATVRVAGGAKAVAMANARAQAATD